MSYEEEMEAALIADGEKLRALTGEDCGPWTLEGGEELPPSFEPEEPVEVAELREQLATVLAERDHWKANHAEMVQRNAVLRERPDLPADRLPSIARYEGKIKTLENALREISEETEIHTKINQVRLCCKFQDIAIRALGDQS